MAILTLTKAQLLDGQLLDPDWYEMSVKEFRMHAKNGSVMYFVTFILTSHPAKPEVTVMYNEYNMQLFKSMYAACVNKTVQQLVDETDEALQIDTDDVEGASLKGLLFHETRKDTQEQKNAFKDFLPVGVTNPL